MGSELAHCLVLLNVLSSLGRELLLDQETTAHFWRVGVDPSTFVKAQIVTEVLAAVDVGEAIETLARDFIVVD